MAFDSFNSHPLANLERADLDLIVALVLESGSLKGLASAYGVSYPTIRGRLDRVIERLRDAVEGREPDPLRDLLADLVERGELTVTAARQIRDAARKEHDHVVD
ncbi:MAG: DUF2089 family protein [Phycisphaerales bacterium]|nr:DUF2089 family protein [Phycisphaerales bacterium]